MHHIHTELAGLGENWLSRWMESFWASFSLTWTTDSYSSSVWWTNHSAMGMHVDQSGRWWGAKDMCRMASVLGNRGVGWVVWEPVSLYLDSGVILIYSCLENFLHFCGGYCVNETGFKTLASVSCLCYDAMRVHRLCASFYFCLALAWLETHTMPCSLCLYFLILSFPLVRARLKVSA